jgi:D-3-phosphoglycerate dehydrogenase
MPKKVLMLNWRLTDQERVQVNSLLGERDCELIPSKPSDELSRAEVLELVREADGLVTGVEHPADAALMDAAPNLRVISAFGVGYDHIDIEAASERGIVVAVSAGCNEHNVAELAFTMMLNLAKRFPRYDREMRGGLWGYHNRDDLGSELWGKTLGIIGLGRVGKAASLIAKGFGMRVLANDVAWDITFANEHGISYVTLDALLQHSDFVTLHCPLTPLTRGLINERTLGLMKPTAFLINTARGPIVEEAALVAALREGKILGAGLDVFAVEPHPNNPYLEMANVMLTPHIAGSSVEAIERMYILSLGNITNVLSGIPPYFQVNPGIGPRRVPVTP